MVLLLSDDYARIDVNTCKKVWLNRVRAKLLVIKDSEGPLEHVEISEGVVVEKSELSFTGGALRGDVALEVSESKLDVAGVRFWGTTAALRVRRAS